MFRVSTHWCILQRIQTETRAPERTETDSESSTVKRFYIESIKRFWKRAGHSVRRASVSAVVHLSGHRPSGFGMYGFLCSGYPGIRIPADSKETWRQNCIRVLLVIYMVCILPLRCFPEIPLRYIACNWCLSTVCGILIILTGS